MTSPTTPMMKILVLSLLALLPVAPGFGKNSVDAIQLEHIPLDASIECSRTFFKSSRHFNGTIYVMPRVVPEQREGERPAFEIESDGKGHFTLFLGLYFPRNEEQVRGEWDTDLVKNSRCNFDIVKDELNRGLRDPKQQVVRIAPMPLTSIEVRVPGVNNTGRIGRSLEVDDEVDLLDYDGKSLPIEISLTSDEKDEVIRRMDRNEGLPVEVRFRFQARSREGAVTASLDWRELSSSLSVALSGKAWITQAELESAVKASVKSMSASIKIDSGRSESFEKITNLVVQKVMAQADAVVSRGEGARDSHDSQKSKSRNAGKEAKTAKTPSVGSGLLSVKAVLDVVSSQGTSEIDIEQTTAPETATAETIVRFRAKAKDPDLHEVRVRAGFHNPTFHAPIRAGQTIRIQPAYHFLAKYSFANARRTYLTEAQIRELRLAEKFPSLVSEQMVVKNLKLGPNLVGVGRWIPLAGLSPVYSPTRYLWRRAESVREIIPDFSRALPPGLETFKKLPIGLAFSKHGGRSNTRLIDMLGDHAGWKASLDESGAMVLTAKEDLGLMTFVERFERDQALLVPGEKDLVIRDMVMDSVVEERRSFDGSVATSAPVALRRDPLTIVQSRFVVFMVTSPQSSP